MGLDAYLGYECTYRPGGAISQLTELEYLARVRSLMDQHGVPSVTLQVGGAQGVETRTIHRAEVEQAAGASQHLRQLCLTCPVSDQRGTPGCQARLNYPVDEPALTVMREALGEGSMLFDVDADPEIDRFVRTLARDGWDGRRMEQLVRRLGEEPRAVGSEAVAFDLDDMTVWVTPYMVLEYLCFQTRFDPAEVRAASTWYRWFHIAVGNRIGSAADPHAAARDLFGGSASLRGLAALAQLNKRAEEHGLGLLLDG
ncbi:hypothetical protein GCM10010168_77280 [Actinoplanes ianthinogenes]|uniref:Uncharacterized protein n=1 Tax=Actinoplanes ianthinogenes TaxID=122358 RepID=A0ABM7M9L3_9ACTN|nr:hypothetical protein [Actinoplanes ianthinogenes]BCJ48346.1 hypothetical protein Aiant_90030 [Actinoplanes ianthinogenes]GGR46992.1 hypothetical protein GCM10010168_77280 [Actinoplanes ianthinogenes]